MKQITIEVTEKLEGLLIQFLNTDIMGTKTPIFVVQDTRWLSEEYDDIACFFSKEEAKKYLQYQKHNLNAPRIYAKYPGHNNEGDFGPFYNLLRDIAKQL